MDFIKIPSLKMKIPYQQYRLSLTALDDLYLPPYKGSTLRGGFGNAFKRVVCALKKKECAGCMLKSNCIYSYIFETSLDRVCLSKDVPANANIPRPFVIEPPLEGKGVYEQGEILSFNLLLIGRAVEYLPYFIYTFDILGDMGIGKKQGRYLLSQVFVGDREIYNNTDKTINPISHKIIDLDEGVFMGSSAIISRVDGEEITLKFLTPVRLRFNRDLAVKIDFHILIRNALRRLCVLSVAHCSNSLPAWDYRAIIGHAEAVQIVRDDSHWHDWQRYSSRQQSSMKLGGVIGEITYRGNIMPFMPILRAIEIIHIGKGTAFGLGKILIKP